MQIELDSLKRLLYEENAISNIKFYRGTYADASSEDMAGEINKFFAAPLEEDAEND